MDNNNLLGAIEAGGTKMVCATGYEDGSIAERIIVKTGDPEPTMAEIISFFHDKPIKALGIASFGPVGIVKGMDTYGHILNTPKLRWAGFDILGVLKNALNVPMEIDTDVNGSVLGEKTFGSSRGLDNLVYITIGTGIGAGILINGKLVHGQLHPEVGHMLIDKRSDDKTCICPFHESCFEGLASGPSIKARFGKNAYELENDNKVWDLEGYYIAKAITNLIMTLCPERFILGGGVMHQLQLFPIIRKYVSEMVNGYLDIPGLKNIDDYIVPASLHDDQGIMGALTLANAALKGEMK